LKKLILLLGLICLTAGCSGFRIRILKAECNTYDRFGQLIERNNFVKDFENEKPIYYTTTAPH